VLSLGGRLLPKDDRRRWASSRASLNGHSALVFLFSFVRRHIATPDRA
jgi:hypothetical protein